jgi:hypothetical protein
MGIMGWLHAVPGWDRVYGSTGLTLLMVAAALACLAAALGLWTRWTTKCAAVLTLLHGGILREYSHFFHTMLVPLQMSVVLAFSSTRDGFAVGRREPRYRSIGHYDRAYSICLLVLCSAYLCAGLSKLRNAGPQFWDGENLRRIVQQNALNTMEIDLGLSRAILSLPLSVFAAIGIGVVMTELAFPLVLVSVRARLVLPIFAIAMHLGILLSAPRWIMPALCAVGAVWIARIEYFPLTAWQIYSWPAGEVRVWRMTATHRDGTDRPFRPDAWIPALHDCRYRDHLMRGDESTSLLLGAVLKTDPDLRRLDIEWGTLDDPAQGVVTVTAD